MCLCIFRRWLLRLFRIVSRAVLYALEERQVEMGLMLRGRKPSIAQLFGWLLLLLQFPLQAFSALPILTPYLSGMYVLALLFISIQVFILTIFDAIPELLVQKRRLGIKPAPYDPIRYRHVIEHSYCNICQIQVKNDTKHCRRCNMCVEDFDHHCVWLNNCVGRYNYKQFMVLILSLALFSTSSAILQFVVLAYFLMRADNAPFVQVGDMIPLKHFYVTEIDHRLWLAATVTCLFIDLVCAFLSLHLLIFHFQILRQGISTYMFMRRQETPGRDRATITATNDTVGTNVSAQSARRTSTSPMRNRVADSSPHTPAARWAEPQAPKPQHLPSLPSPYREPSPSDNPANDEPSVSKL